MLLFFYIEHCLTRRGYSMTTKKIATNIPNELLREAVKLTGLNQTRTLIEGLKELIAQKKRMALLALKGKLHFSIDTNKSRQRKIVK